MDTQPRVAMKPDNWVPILEQPLGTKRKLRLICLGAGFSGLTLAWKIKHGYKYDDFIDLQIYEKNPDLGGTWYENRYPGVACDIPAHTYSFTFEPNPDWSSFYASGPEIFQYIKNTAKKWHLEDCIQYNSKVTDSIWDEDISKWKVKISQKSKFIEDECDILINASGILNKWAWPKIEGLHDFQGKLMHTANWDMSYDWTGKKVAVIGNGSSAIQIVPQLQRTAKQLSNYIRSPTWIAANYFEEFSEDKEDKSHKFSEEQKKKFRESPELLLQLRKKLDHGLNHGFIINTIGTPAQQEMSRTFRNIMETRLGGNPELIKRFVPTFEAGCRRVTPGEGYLEALQRDNVRCIWSPIIKFTEKGILTAEGEEEYDMIVAATGFDVSFKPNWNLIGRNGADLKKIWAEDPISYFGMCAVEHPNYFIIAGPNIPIAHGALHPALEQMSAYVLKWSKKIATEDVKSVTVKAKVVDDVDVWSQELLKRTVWAGNCRSWYKNGKVDGKLTATHAGSAMHYREILEHIRGEDFEIEYRSPNRFQFLGNGLTQRDVTGGDLSYYLEK